MKCWVTNPYHKIDTNILAQIEEFALSIQSSARMKEIAMDLLRSVTKERVRFQSLFQLLILSHLCAPLLQPPPNCPSLLNPAISRSVNPEPQDLAIALMILEGDNYARIIPGDYISYLRRLGGISNIQAACTTNDRIINWVKHGVLRNDDLETRSNVLKFFVNTALVTLTHLCCSYHLD
jgi:son of sevenless-like protein